MQVHECGSASVFRYGDAPDPAVDAAALGELAALIERGELSPLVGAEFALDDVQKAHELSEYGRANGKIAVQVGAP